VYDLEAIHRGNKGDIMIRATPAKSDICGVLRNPAGTLPVPGVAATFFRTRKTIRLIVGRR